MVADDFSDQSHWQESSGPTGTVAYETNALSLALPAGKTPLVSISDHILPGDFYLELTMDVLMCSEEDPAICHRHHLIGRYLTKQGITVWHIRSDGNMVRDQALPNLKSELPVEQPTLFDIR